LRLSALISDLRFQIRDPLAELGKLELPLLDLQVKLVTLALQLVDFGLHLSGRLRMGLPISEGLLELPLVVLRELKFVGFEIFDPLLELPLLEDVGTGQDLGLLVRGKVMGCFCLLFLKDLALNATFERFLEGVFDLR
jgi:hypothetical protein